MFLSKRRIFVFSLSISVLFFDESITAQEPLWGGYSAGVPLSAMTAGTNNLTDGTKKFFLLKTGLLVDATVTTGEDFVKLKSQYGTMHVPKENIEFAGETREEVYRYKKSLIAPNSCTQELNFAEWCLNNGFHDEALAEFQVSLLTAPNDNLKNYIQRRIEQVRHNTVQNDTIQNNTVQNGFVQNGSVQNGTAAGYINTATDDDAVDSDTVNSDTANSFDNWANGVPKSVFDTFAKKVHPILVQRCASAACHGSNSSQKFKIAVPRQPGGKTTRNNLRATVQFINPDNPGASPILSALVAQHAGKRALFSVESEQYNNVIDWFQLAAKELPPEWQNEMIAQNAVKSAPPPADSVKPAVKPTVSPPDVQAETVKVDTLPKQFQDSLEAMTKAGLTKTGLKIQTASAIPNVAEKNVAEKNIAEKNVTEKKGENKPESETDPFDPFRFNSKYHSEIIEAKLKKQVSDTVIR